MPSSPNSFDRILGALAQAGRVLAGRQIAGRGVTVFPDDIFLVSYPRSGNTWMRFLLANLIYPNQPATFSNIESRIPEIYFNPDRFMRQFPRPRLLKSHECFQPHYPRVIYLVRDPRDVAISFYHHHVKARNLPDGYPLVDFVPRFLVGEFDPKFGSWRDNVLSWTVLRGSNPAFLQIRYEDLQRDPVHELAKVVEFLERSSFPKIDSSTEAFERAIALSSPERMRALEQKEAGTWVLTKGTRKDKPFVRSATVGGWKSQLAPESIVAIESAWGDVMQNLGYGLVSTPSPTAVEAISQSGSPS